MVHTSHQSYILSPACNNRYLRNIYHILKEENTYMCLQQQVFVGGIYHTAFRICNCESLHKQVFVGGIYPADILYRTMIGLHKQVFVGGIYPVPYEIVCLAHLQQQGFSMVFTQTY